MPDDLLHRELRANPAYELCLFDRLPAEARKALAALADDPELYGVLRPRAGSALATKSVDRDTALLFLTLREPGSLPSYAVRAMGDGLARAVGRLVADAVLEIRAGDAFVSGAAADILLGSASHTPRGPLGELSIAALRYAEQLPIDDAPELASRLYAYNTVPITPRWRARLASAEAVRRFLGAARELRGWTPSSAANGYWQTWHRSSGEASTHKLYISPSPEALATSFAAIVSALAASGTTQFKVGTTAHGLLRPDKIVAYYPSFDRLAAAAAVVEEALRGVPAQGVPFTAPVGADALLSWGADPPRSSSAALTGGGSWRYWLVHRLARGIVSCGTDNCGTDNPVGPRSQFALDRLALEGVDVERWVPSASLWRMSA